MNETNCWMLALFDNEEVGSNTAQVRPNTVRNVSQQRWFTFAPLATSP
jgi:aspartyl aminopeptidase